MVRLLHKEDQIGIVGLLNDASDVHGVVDLVLGLQHLFKAKVVVTLLQSVKRYVLVVLSEDVAVMLSRASCRRCKH